MIQLDAYPYLQIFFESVNMFTELVHGHACACVLCVVGDICHAIGECLVCL